MRVFLGVAILLVGASVLEILVPGPSVYHAGWYNVLLLALVVVAILTARQTFSRLTTRRARVALVAIVFGAVGAGLSAAASGLLAPDNSTIYGAPGQRAHVDELGATLVFPFAAPEAREAPLVTLQRSFGAPIAIGARTRVAGSFALRTTLRQVVYVEAFDRHGARLTVTQPTGAVFLSPVLLMQHRQTIAGMDLPYDTFSVPAARRVIKTILFTPQEAAMLMHGTGVPGASAVLFAVDDEEGHPIPHSIALASDGRDTSVGDLRLRAFAVGYPAVEIMAVPAPFIVVPGALLVLAGIVALLAGYNRPDVAQADGAVGERDSLRGKHVDRDEAYDLGVGRKAHDNVSPPHLRELRRIE